MPFGEQALNAARLESVRQLVAHTDVLLEVMLLANRDISTRLIQNYLTPLDEHPLLHDTIGTYIRLGQSAQATADQLVVHVNTIAYRLRRVRGRLPA